MRANKPSKEEAFRLTEERKKSFIEVMDREENKRRATCTRPVSHSTISNQVCG